MIRIFYTSHAEQNISDEKVQDILKTSRLNNKVESITGVLIHGGDRFAQIIEGPEHAVLRLYGKILDDRRHSDCRIILASPTNEPMFKTWSMGIIKSSPLEFQKITEFMALREETVHSKAFTNGMSEFVRMLNECRSQDISA